MIELQPNKFLMHEIVDLMACYAYKLSICKSYTMQLNLILMRHKMPLVTTIFYMHGVVFQLDKLYILK